MNRLTITILLFATQVACIPPFCIENDNGDPKVCFGEDANAQFDETGGEENNLCTTFEGHLLCVDVPASDARMQKAIDDGAFVVFDENATCENPSDEWECMVRYSIFDSVVPINCRFCDGFGPPSQPHTLCNPEMAAWESDGLVAAVTPDYDGNNPDCSNMPPFKAFYAYDSKLVCEYEVACLDANTECSCKCDEERGTCSETQATLNEQYYDDIDLGGDDFNPGLGWEFFCSGFPWKWSDASSTYIGTTCEWNQAEPQPGETPNPFAGDRDVNRPMWPSVPSLDIAALVNEAQPKQLEFALPDGTIVQKDGDGVWRRREIPE